MTSNDYYANIKNAVDLASGGEERVEVNQRALIDKILARYASAGAVYRELLQNSNDAEATTAEIYFTTNREGKKNVDFVKTESLDKKIPSTVHLKNAGKDIVSNVTYRNNGLLFRSQDWSRLKKIAEGNPDESKIGAFGVGAYTMFSICEEPMVLSGNAALAFFWKGDALWTKTIKTADRPKEDQAWTSFVLPSRDPYLMPDLVDFGEFLCASLTFTKCLREIRVYVNRERRLSIVKTPLTEPTVVNIGSKTSSNWFSWTASNSKGGVTTVSPNGLFALRDDQSLEEKLYHIQVELDGNVAGVTARYLSAVARTNIPAEMIHRMERVTKKKPPSKVDVQIFLSHDQTIDGDDTKLRKDRDVRRIAKSFSPRVGEGRIFIGFRTSQTTGLAAHLAAPFVPTVERESIDLQDQTLRMFNSELLDFAGIMMRLTIEHSMMALGIDYEKGASARREVEMKLMREAQKIQIENNRKNEKDGETNHGQILSLNDSFVNDDLASSSGTSQVRTTKSLFGFAKFMAKGVRKTIKKVVTNVSDFVDEAVGGELIHPLDPRPLSTEEHQCILLMQSFCPQQSTPDPLVGTILAQGFSRCIDRAPPVLTRSGVVPGDQARLPNKGMEAFVEDDVVRSIIYQNAEEYHDVIAQCEKLTLDDLTLKLSKDVLEESKLIRLIKWWVKFNKFQPCTTTVQSSRLKDKVRFMLENENKYEKSDVLPVYWLKDFLFYVDKDIIRCGNGHNIEDLPMPDCVLPRRIQGEVTGRILSDKSLNAWFSPLPVELWIDFISQHPCMTSGEPEYEEVRLRVLSTLCNEYRNRTSNHQKLFGNSCQKVLKDKRCIPIDSSEPMRYSADLPSNLYLCSAELKMFANVGNFRKVSTSLQLAGVNDEFLLLLGVRKSVSVDFLFENLHTLKYTDDPKPLVEYLQSATLSKTDVKKLKDSQYLPAENDASRMFAPAELYLPDPTFRIFPFIRLLQWPSEDDISERSLNGKFLVSMGVKPVPELLQILRYASSEVPDGVTRLQCLDFVANRLGSGGTYQLEYSRLSRSDKSNLKFLPCLIASPLSGEEKQTCCSTLNCCSNPAPGVMGFPILNIDGKNKLYGNLFQCAEEPSPAALLQQLKLIVSLARRTLHSGAGEKQRKEFSHKIFATFLRIFNYMSSRSSEIDGSKLFDEDFIPCLVDDQIQWFHPTEVFFRSKKSDETGDITRALFPVVEFSPFLASAGVRQEPSTRDIFKRMIKSPKEVFAAVQSEGNYRALLRRIASHPPFTHVTDEIRESPFLLAYSVTETTGVNEEMTYELAKATDIFVIDNSVFGRMFSVKRAPNESHLEEFYVLLGAEYISKVVRKKFDIVGAYEQGTNVSNNLMERIQERTPLLISAGSSSRSLLVHNAQALLDLTNLKVVQAPDIKANYSLGKSVRTQKTTCCVRGGMFGKNSIVVTEDFDWFDVGYIIGELILKRCLLEDAFLISSLLETPLDQLKARGFPVDRIIKPEPLPEYSGVSSPLRTKETEPNQESKIDNDSKSIDDHSENGLDQIEIRSSQNDHIFRLKQMYPGINESYLQDKLGKNPNIDKVRSIAEELATQGYPEEELDNQSTSKSSKLLGFKKLGKVLKNFGGLPNNLKRSGSQSLHKPSTGERYPVAPKDDAILHSDMERMLEKKVRSSPHVSAAGIKSAQESMDIPEGLGHGSTCEVIPSQDIIPFVGNNGKMESHNGIKLFYYRKEQSSKQYLRVNHDAVENFAVVLERLCRVFELPLASVAIYHDPTGKAIAFNSGGALYFNVRYFFGLHYSKNVHRSKACYSYWYVVACHELAHNLEGPHNSTHAFYTESYTSLYLPKLMEVLAGEIEEKILSAT